MFPDADTCYRAYESRDARFDGKFFTAVLTTGIYCRPICPARTPLRRNVRFFACAAAAEEAGFRPCRRCRPEAAPGSPSWNGTSTTVARALRLIDDGYLDERGADALADKLGVGERHLRRLFTEHLGAGPGQVARTRRLHFARTLVEGTQLPLAEVAFAAGFQSIRQFNDAFRQSFRQPPSAVRRQISRPRNVHTLACAQDGACSWCDAGARPLTLRLAYRPPLDWEGMLAFLSARALRGVEHIDGDVYLRAFELDGDTGWFSVRPAPQGHALELAVHGGATRALTTLVSRVRRVFDLDADPAAIAAVLGQTSALRTSIGRRPGLRVVGAFEPFEGAVRIVVGQQVSVAGARTVLSRLCADEGMPVRGAPHGVTHTFARPDRLRRRQPSSLGMPEARGRTLIAIAERAAKHPERGFEELPGIGPWTRSILEMRVQREPDAFPEDDLALRRALSRPGDLPVSSAMLREAAESWRPWRAYAAMHLWAIDAARETARRRNGHVLSVAP